MRIPHWPRVLDEYVQAARGRPFAWGAHDCCTFAAGAVQAITGRAIALPAYVGVRQALRALQARGGLLAAVRGQLGPMQAPARARRGDVLLLWQAGRDVLAVNLGHAWAAPGADGLVFGPTDDAVAAWRVD